MTLPKNEQGQISIFFSASLVVIVSLVAFIINIGLFVKAKINLQNATDSAAFAGAAVQSRQLTRIAYLNWEMRNVFKEWMFKYYVVGNLNNKDVISPNSGSGPMKYNLETDNDVIASRQTPDPFNIPIVCLHIEGSQTNICKRYSVPGIPEFGSSNIIGAEQASRALIDSIIAAKSANCIDRTKLNMLVANTWAYNVVTESSKDSLSGQGPSILTDRSGAWPKAVELALRIRNLEYVMNRPPQTSGVCREGSTTYGKTRCRSGIQEIESQSLVGNERIVKAFYSAYRNLGNDVDDEMKKSFTLTEIPPQEVTYDNDADASNLLSSQKGKKKYWVDLKLMMVNYATFYAAMIPRAERNQGTPVSGACDISKVALPVPGYPMGFYKDPNVLTYYAVKGEAEFVGMFNPFKVDAIKLHAYAAAKPFGGRIGPALFIQKEGTTYLTSRTTKKRSVPYITSYEFTGTKIRGQEITGTNFVAGTPLPTNSTQSPGSFWLESETSTLGGKPTDATSIQFGVPNLVYDYESPFETTGYTDNQASINKINSAAPGGQLSIGLFSRNQFQKFKGGIQQDASPERLRAEIGRVRAPTQYEAANYLIPSPTQFNFANALDTFGIASGEGEDLKNGYTLFKTKIFAPLVRGPGSNQNDVLFNNVSELTSSIYDFMRVQEIGMKKYRLSMNRAAQAIYNQRNNIAAGAEGTAAGYVKAAEGVSDINFTGDIDQLPNSCNSLAGQFLYFYFGGGVAGSEVPKNSANCPKPLGDLLQEYFSSTNNFDATFYDMDLTWKTSEINQNGRKYMSAYMPGPFTGVNQNGQQVNPIDSDISENMWRNQYSTKFVPVNSLRQGGGARWDNARFPIYSEGGISSEGSNPETGQKRFANPLRPETVNADDLDTINY